jgi:hypothetical protein
MVLSNIGLWGSRKEAWSAYWCLFYICIHISCPSFGWENNLMAYINIDGVENKSLDSWKNIELKNAFSPSSLEMEVRNIIWFIYITEATVFATMTVNACTLYIFQLWPMKHRHGHRTWHKHWYTDTVNNLIKSHNLV